MHLLCGAPKTEIISGSRGYGATLTFMGVTYPCVRLCGRRATSCEWLDKTRKPLLLRGLSTWACFVSVPFIFVKEINFRGVTICLPQRDYT